jgi:hypothetical protein
VTLTGISGEGALLRATIDQIRPALGMATGAFWNHSDPADAYTRYLTGMYPIARAAIPLMRFARQRCARRRADPLSDPLIAFFSRHMDEERGHDRWVAADLAALGHDTAQLKDALPIPAVAALIGAQYHLIAAVHPITLLGCIAVLECDPPTDALLAHVRGVIGQLDAMVTLAGHAVSDAEHGADVFALLDSLRLDGHLRAAVGFSALYTARQSVALFAELARQGTPGGPESLATEIDCTLAEHAEVAAHAADVTGGLIL